MAHILRNKKIKCPMRPSCPESGRLGHEGHVTFEFFHFYIEHHQSQADFAEVISRGIGIREIVAPFFFFFYEIAIVENEN